MNAREHNRRRLADAIESVTGVRLNTAQLTKRAEQIARDAEAGRLDHHDSLIMGEFATFIIKECA